MSLLNALRKPVPLPSVRQVIKRLIAKLTRAPEAIPVRPTTPEPRVPHVDYGALCSGLRPKRKR